MCPTILREKLPAMTSTSAVHVWDKWQVWFLQLQTCAAFHFCWRIKMSGCFLPYLSVNNWKLNFEVCAHGTLPFFAVLPKSKNHQQCWDKRLSFSCVFEQALARTESEGLIHCVLFLVVTWRTEHWFVSSWSCQRLLTQIMIRSWCQWIRAPCMLQDRIDRLFFCKRNHSLRFSPNRNTETFWIRVFYFQVSLCQFCCCRTGTKRKTWQVCPEVHSTPSALQRGCLNLCAQMDAPCPVYDGKRWPRLFLLKLSAQCLKNCLQYFL